MGKISKRVLIIIAVGVILGIAVGVIIGYFVKSYKAGDHKLGSGSTAPPAGSKSPSYYAKLAQDGDEDISKAMIEMMDKEEIRKNLRTLTRYPHVAGLLGSLKSAEEVLRRWKTELDEADIVTYDVLLSYPPMPPGINATANKVQLLSSSDTLIFQSQITEAPLDDPDLKNENNTIVPPFNAYAKAGNVTSDELIYVNYGRIEDFLFLKRNKSIDVTGKLVIARYGKIYRGNKVQHAHMFGASGMILYSDPRDYYSPESGQKPFPDSWWLPGTGVQRGSTFLGNGDPRTPNYPSLPYAYTSSEEEYGKLLPRIPAQPIGYNDAKILLDNMNCTQYGQVNEEWRGALNNTKYCYGGKLANTQKVRLEVNNKNVVAKAYNVIGVIRGEIEPDRYVLLGNHRDAWVFGAVDPTSGTAAMLEVTRVMSKLRKEKNWRPRRSMMFCSWGAEEYGLIGSTEWVEENIKKLQERAVAYINVDIAVEYSGSLHIKGSPLLHHAITQTTKKVPDPSQPEDNMEKTLFTASGGRQKIGQLGSGSDHAPFYIIAGVPAIDMSFSFTKKEFNIASYPMYHSVYETYKLVDTYIDPTFRYHQASARLWGELGRYLADTVIIPMNVTEYSQSIKTMRATFLKNEESKIRKTTYQNLSDPLDYFINVTNHFEEVAQEFSKKLSSTDKSAPFDVRRVNDQMMQLERAFTDPLGLPDRKDTKHVISAPSSKNSYAGSMFPGLSDALFDIDNCNVTSNACHKQWELVAKQLSVVTFTIQSAASTLEDVTQAGRGLDL